MRWLLFTALGLLEAVSAALPPRSLCSTTRQLYQYPNFTFIENIAVRPNGHLLLDTFDDAKMYTLDPSQPNPETRLVAQPAGVDALTGIAEVAPDVFAVTGGMLNITSFSFVLGTGKVFLVDFRSCKAPSDKPTVQHIASIPDANILNGMVALPAYPHIILSVESVAGLLYRIDTSTGRVEVAFQDDKLGLGNGPLFTPLGANGIKIHGHYLYFANSNQKFFGRVKITARGDRAGDIEEIVGAPNPTVNTYDDFAMSRDGTAYVSLHDSYLTKITPSGKQTIIAGGESAAVKLYGPTSAALKRDEKVVYVCTGGTTINGTVEGGQILEVRL